MTKVDRLYAEEREEAVKKAVRENTREVAERVTKDVTEKVTKDVTEKVTKDVTKDVTEAIAAKMLRMGVDISIVEKSTDLPRDRVEVLMNGI